MTDIINKLLAIIIMFLILFLAPLNLSNMSDRANKKIDALNEMQLFLDKITDKGYITERDMDELYLAMEATGLSLSVELEHFRLLADGDAVVLCKECTVDKERIALEKGKYEIEITDVLKLSVEEVAESREARLWRKIGGTQDLFVESLSAMRR